MNMHVDHAERDNLPSDRMKNITMMKAASPTVTPAYPIRLAGHSLGRLKLWGSLADEVRNLAVETGS